MSHLVDGSGESDHAEKSTPTESPPELPQTAEESHQTVAEILAELEKNIPKLDNYLSFQKMGILFSRHEVLQNRLKSVRKRLATNQYEGNVDENDRTQVENFQKENENEITDITQNLESLNNEIDLLLPLAKKQGEQCLGQANASVEELTELKKNKTIGDREKIQDVLKKMRNNIISVVKNDLRRIEEWPNKKEIESTNTLSRDEIPTLREENFSGSFTSNKDHVSLLTSDREIIPSLQVRLDVNENYLKNISAQRNLPEDKRTLEPKLRGDALLDQEIAYVSGQIFNIRAEIKAREAINVQPDIVIPVQQTTK
ncbi:MAG: hypothetical protein A2821_01025 [Candidatus Magasanikbacteria bacterium RIFCSPHIGHO2_01_FULL_41_23]|uniref:Uncharacterized protein n=1 Tax=Candidatus Magasanikbacteria bacterium RIFCSPLOWO2_01_FULL_40_15 TaxID=1798686 RepID=A0A1F6N1Q4_9BACT|nr:MAG: hypothetical protein A2821_01025 [Candidatus Magasanikbacteria bacterium RIFCSPHIGHO2_01_FULL_41_23]OGH66670.1 MAG: hypothetical protein A3C66_01385 [Candidatus Magasanikbacteria bacterium RIFCSPHIGHO2_02_FULL_41_35]OGH74792.1 MAG: hypothetical protein A3F22_03765 [Candidatus Magasanikbacteria bacterium RIFCSPHIGHO2_12_FULL_41_16]OGH77926.1 MAG: hypothetical protein A2983_00385 [Candidatus Magasanikbacteria bacterium RIFCSPLOWO2_01_FULL_40_15]